MNIHVAPVATTTDENSMEFKYFDQLHAQKYRDENQPKEDHIRNIAYRLSSSEHHFEALYDSLYYDRFLPAGRVQAAMGASEREVSAFNCSVSQTIHDDMRSIMDALTNAAMILRLGTGIGYNFSNIRPKGALIKKLKTDASGPISFMRMFDTMASTIASSGHRRGAQMGILNVSHPDIEEFIDAKMVQGAFTYFNISVGISDSFMQAVEQDSQWDLTFDGAVYKTVSARVLWDKIIKNAYDSAEPGIIFIDRLNDQNNLYYCEYIEATNPCVTFDTKILTKDGYRQIGTLVGKQVEVWNGNQWSKVTPKVTGENQKILVVTFDNGMQLECTPYHKFITETGIKKEAKDLIKGETLKQFNFPLIDGGRDVNSAYVEGFYQGDGWQDARGRQWIALYGEKQNLIDLFPYDKYAEYDIKGGYPGTDTDQTRLMFRVHGMPDKGTVPSVEYSVKSRLAWLAGLADSDGTTTHSEESISLQISNKNYDFICSVAHTINTLGVFCRVSRMRDSWRLTVKSSELKKLQDLGFTTYRLNIEENNPKYQVQNKIKVVSIHERPEIEAKVYCFNEPIEHQGVFNGVLTGQCAEQPLPPHGLCLLGSFNLPAYFDKRGDFQVSLLKQDIRNWVEAYDNIFEKSVYAIKEHEIEAVSKRRIGLGFTGIANAVEYLCGEPNYGEEKFCEVLDELCRILRDEAYSASIELAKVRGPFQLFDPSYLDGEFVRTLPDNIRSDLALYGIRNSHLISYAPCGTISQCAHNVSSGVEPTFHHEVARNVIMKEGKINVTLKDFNVRKYGFKGKTLEECSIEDHMRVAKVVQKYCDSAVSKTVNVASNCSYEEYEQIYKQAHSLGLKGITVYRPTEKRGIVIAKAEKKVEENKPIPVLSAFEHIPTGCVNGACTL